MQFSMWYWILSSSPLENLNRPPEKLNIDKPLQSTEKKIESIKYILCQLVNESFSTVTFVKMCRMNHKTFFAYNCYDFLW